MPDGEIDKRDEAAIIATFGRSEARQAKGMFSANSEAVVKWVARYVAAFGTQALDGRRISVWSHKRVALDQIIHALSSVFADVVELGRSETFVPVDTEAMPGWARRDIAAWMVRHELDALVPTDGDGGHPLLADETSRVIPGDVIGQVTARQVGAETVVTLVTSNSGAELCGRFASILRTKVGTPFVIKGMERSGGRVAGYEANGGFVLGFDTDADGFDVAPYDARQPAADHCDTGHRKKHPCPT